MRTRLLSVLVLGSLVGLAGCATRPTSPPLVLAAGVEVTGDDLRNELHDARPTDIAAVLADEAALNKLIDHLYARRRMTALAGELGYLDRESVKHRLQRDRELLLLALTPRLYAESVVVPDSVQLAREYYDAHPAEFTTQEEVRASHILVQAGTAAEKKRRRPEAEKLLARLRKGEDFGELAKAHSDDGSAQTLGDLGFFRRGMMVPAFEEVAFGLSEPGALSELVETPYGWHIIKLTDRRPTQLIPFEEVRERLAAKLEREYRDRATEEWRRNAMPENVAKLPEAEAAALLDSLRAEFKVAVPQKPVAADAKDAAAN